MLPRVHQQHVHWVLEVKTSTSASCNQMWAREVQQLRINARSRSLVEVHSIVPATMALPTYDGTLESLTLYIIFCGLKASTSWLTDLPSTPKIYIHLQSFLFYCLHPTDHEPIAIASQSTCCILRKSTRCMIPVSKTWKVYARSIPEYSLPSHPADFGCEHRVTNRTVNQISVVQSWLGSQGSLPQSVEGVLFIGWTAKQGRWA